VGCFTPLKGYENESNGAWQKQIAQNAQRPMEVACGSCLGCRLDRTLSWAMRITHEASLHSADSGNCFITLTYRDPRECTFDQLKKGLHLPDPPTLVKSHFQKFMKRLRKHVGHKVRYFHCGEYGDETRRPHYHACLFNVSFPDQALWRDNDGVYTFYSPTLERLWPYGFSTVSELNFETAAYTAGYCLKKITGEKADEHYQHIQPDTGELTWLLPPYATMSLKPGIGAQFFKDFAPDFFDDSVPVPGKGVLRKMPRYYEKIMEDLYPREMEKIHEHREKYFQDNVAEYTPERLRAKFRVTEKKQSMKKREI